MRLRTKYVGTESTHKQPLPIATVNTCAHLQDSNKNAI